jgi:hypothetical protein
LLFLRVAADERQPLFRRFLVLLDKDGDFLVFGLEVLDLQMKGRAREGNEALLEAPSRAGGSSGG